jgi:hypothetical protein
VFRAWQNRCAAGQPRLAVAVAVKIMLGGIAGWQDENFAFASGD